MTKERGPREREAIETVLTAEAIAAMPGLAKTHFLNPAAKRINKSLGDETGLTGIGVHLIEVAPGDCSTEFHVHQAEDECVFILSGTAIAEIGEERMAVKAGDFLAHPKGGAPHMMTVTGDEPLRALVIGERLARDVADYPRRRKRLYRQAGAPSDLVDHESITHPTMGAKR